jgi:zinc transporter ZupT
MMAASRNAGSGAHARIRSWGAALFPLIALAAMLSIFAAGNPLASFRADTPPLEDLSLERILVVPEGFEVTLVNNGPDPVTVAQVLVDEAYWKFNIDPAATIPRMGRARLFIPYPWVSYEAHEIRVLTRSGATFDGLVELAAVAPRPGLSQFVAYGLLGVYVGIIPVALGMLWYPSMCRLGKRGMGAVLALTIGLLAFLLVDTLLEALEIAQQTAGVFQGTALALFAALSTWLLISASGGAKPQERGNPMRRAMRLAGLIALGIGLHNLGEGLAIGAAFAQGKASLGSFLVIGFTLHNITEGVGIVAPLVSAQGKASQGTSAASLPSRGLFIFLASLALLAGAPAILGTWIGGFAFSPLLALLFLGIGAGAIWQVMAEVGMLLTRSARQSRETVFSWPNVLGFIAGLAVMYLTALLVSV